LRRAQVEGDDLANGQCLVGFHVMIPFSTISKSGTVWSTLTAVFGEGD
jgi:hypothetical protein